MEAGRLIGSGVPGVVPVSVTCCTLLTSRQSPVDGHRLAGGSAAVRRAAVLPRGGAGNQGRGGGISLTTELKRSMWTPDGLLEHLNVQMGYNPDV